jgi:hypothetical protein
MDKLRLLQFRKLRIAARIDELNELASSPPSEQCIIEIDLVAALEKLRSELADVKEEIKVLVAEKQAGALTVDVSAQTIGTSIDEDHQEYCPGGSYKILR